MKTAKSIVIDWLKAHGCDGLCNTGCGCGCGCDDLIPCDGITDECVAANRHVVETETDEYDVGDVIYCIADVGGE